MKKGAMSLEMIAKWIIILVVVIVALSLIITFKDKIVDAIKGIGGDEQQDPVYVKIGLSSKQLEIGKISELISICYNDRLGKSRDDVCYIVHNKRGAFSMTSEEIKQSLPGGMRDKVIFKTDNFNTQTVVISFAWLDEEVIVEQ